MMGVVETIKQIICNCRICLESESVPDAVWRPNPNAVRRYTPPLQEEHEENGNVVFNLAPSRNSSGQWTGSPFLGPDDPLFITNSMAARTHNYPIRRVPSISDQDCSMPEMAQMSSVITLRQISSLYLTFPPRLRLCPWTLLYTATRDGYSLANLYRKLQNIDCAVLLLILDTSRAAFGAVLSPPNIKMRGKCYTGTLETFLFTFSPRLRKYPATGENEYFVQAMPDSLSIGGWRAAIWLDDNLHRGTTGSSPTFENSPLTDEEFIVRELECWAVTEDELDLDSVDGPEPLCRSISSAYLAERKTNMEPNKTMMVRPRRNTIHLPTRKEQTNTKRGRRRREVMFSLGEEEAEQEEQELRHMRTQSFSELTSVMMMSPDWSSQY